MEFFSTPRRAWITRWENYSHIQDRESSELIEKPENTQQHVNLSSRGLSIKSSILLTGLNILILSVTIFSIVFELRRISRMTDVEAIKRTQSYSMFQYLVCGFYN